ncbi:MAG TPA: 30S ribosomal protein S8 [Candidatus Dojkabacteria bacterium]|nr:30S ribosomal protein S8 [Candidatus Dojkabacteria bacterium]
MDILADTLARLQNAILVDKADTVVLKSKLVLAVLEVLKRESMIESYEEVDGGIKVFFKSEDNEPVVTHFEKVSTPGQRIYVTSSQIVPIMNGRGISIISTSAGVMSGSVAKSKKLGGEYLCKVW